MNRNRKHLWILLLAGLLLTSHLTACGDSGSAETNTAVNNTTETAPAETETERLMPDLPVQDYDGYEFAAIHWQISDDWKSRLVNDFCVEDVTGDALNDAVYNRNAVIADTYNITYRMEYADVNPPSRKWCRPGTIPMILPIRC